MSGSVARGARSTKSPTTGSKELSAPHTVASSIATGTWTVTGVRPHQNLADHSGDFFPVSVTLTVIGVLRQRAG